MYIVTGAAGFIGSAIVWYLNQQGIDQIIIVDEVGSDSKWLNLRKLRFVDYLHKQEFLARVMADQFITPLKAVIHMGACSSTTETDVDFLLTNNYRYSLELAQFCERREIRFIYASSGATYGDGALGYDDQDAKIPSLKALNPYGYSKQLFDLWVLRNRFEKKCVGLKFFNVFGPNEYHKGDMRSVAHKSFCQIRESGAVNLFRSYHKQFADGEQKRDFIYIKDCLKVIWWFLENPKINGIFNLGTGKARSWNELTRAVFAALKLPPKINYVDMPIEIRGQYQYFTEARMQKLREAGFKEEFMSLEDSVADYVNQHLLQSDAYL